MYHAARPRPRLRRPAAYDRYRRELTWFHAQERRFADEPFWRHRITR